MKFKIKNKTVEIGHYFSKSDNWILIPTIGVALENWEDYEETSRKYFIEFLFLKYCFTLVIREVKPF